MDRIAPIPSSTLPVIAAKPITYKDPVWVPLPEQDAVERNSLIAVKAWQSLFKGLPLEIVSMIFTETLWGLTITEILNIAEYEKGQLAPEAWPELYKASVLAFGSIETLSEWLSSPTQFRNFVEDAQKYGDKTLRQIFYGLRLLQKMESPISIEEGMRAGILRREHVCSENALPIIKVQQDFLSWLGEKKARMAVYLRWFPAQARDPEALNPDLLEDAVEHHNRMVVEPVCVYMQKHGLHNGDDFRACRRALRAAVMRSDVEIAEYLLDEFPEGRRAQGILQTAAKKGCLPMVQVLLEKKVEINALDDYKKTALQAVIDAFYPFEIFALYSEYDGKKYQKAFDQLEVIIFLLRQYVDKKLAFNINWELRGKNTFLHMACYVQDSDSALWLAQFILEQQKDKDLLKAQNEYGESPFACALEADNDLMYTFLHEQWAKRIPEMERSTVLSLQERQVLRTASDKASPTTPSPKPVLPAPITIQNALPAAVQPLPITAPYTPSAQEISWLHTWVQTFVDFSKYLLAIVFFIPRVLYTFYLDIIRASGKQS